MNKQKKELLRINNMINNDRVNVNENFEKLFFRDLSKLLKEYFELKKEPSVNISVISGEYALSIEAVAFSLKKFNDIN